jgi:hypothetical protein
MRTMGPTALAGLRVTAQNSSNHISSPSSEYILITCVSECVLDRERGEGGEGESEKERQGRERE